jgi:Recombination endonuclease VII
MRMDSPPCRQCTKCGLDRPVSPEFWRNQKTCKQCYRDRAAETARARRRGIRRPPASSDGTRECKVCGVRKPLTREFFGWPQITSAGNPSYERRCRDCSLAPNNEYQKTRKYGISRAELRALLARVSCDVCAARFSPELRRNIDHCHASGRIRGVLCGNCNLALGHLKEDPLMAERAAAYLRATG